MKKSLGSLLILCAMTLFAKPLANVSYTISNKTPFVKEAVVITFEIMQKDHTTNMFFYLTPKQSQEYQIILLEKNSHELAKHNTKATFSYLLFPLKAKTITPIFELSIKTASDQAVRQAFVSDHDQSNSVDKKLREKRAIKLTLTTQPLKKDVDCVGDFQLTHTIDAKTIHPYESLNLSYTLKGIGWKKEIASLLPQIKGVTIFSEKEEKAKRATKKGFIYHTTYLYSISSDQNFTIPALTLQAFNPKTNSYYTLTAPSYHILVQKLDAKKLLDSQDAPLTKPPLSLQKLQEILWCFFVFAFGFATAKLLRFQKPTNNRLFEDIRQTKDAKELVLLLVTNYKHYNFLDEINQLEKIIYNKSGKFEAVKKEVLQKLEKDYS